MKVAYLITGSGDSFYCSNCHRDRLYASSLRETGEVEIAAVPLYLPPIGEDFGDEFDNPVFFGAVSTYLRDRVKLFENAPAFLDRILDAPPMLKFAAKKAGTTRPEGFEETTLNMIRGNDPGKDREIKRLSIHLSENRKPDIIHLSNALIMGLASQLKEALGSKIICSLQNEDDWIEEMAEPYRSKAWKLIGEESGAIDAFISPSEYFKNLIIEKTGINPKKIIVVPSGLEHSGLENIKKSNPLPAIGFFSRLSKNNGIHKIVDAYISIINSGAIPDLELHLCGGYTADDKNFLKKQLKKLQEKGLDDKVKIYNGFSGAQKEEFFSSIDIMSVPVEKHDAYGLYVLTSNSAGVPAIQPATGAFPEIIKLTGGGIIYEPDTSEMLANEIISLLKDKKKLNELGSLGREIVTKKLTKEHIARGILEVYKKVIDGE